MVTKGDHKLAAQPEGGGDDDHKWAARRAARRHDDAEHHRAEPHQRFDEGSIWRCCSQPGSGQGIADSGGARGRRLAAEWRRRRPEEATKNKSPWTVDGEEQRALIGTGGGGRGGRSRPGFAGVCADGACSRELMRVS